MDVRALTESNSRDATHEHQESAVRLGERLLKEIKRPVVTSAGIVEVGASIGLVIVVPGPDLPDNASLMRLADKTMQAVKRDGGGVRLYDPDSPDD